ncbi:MAG TPA: hypothetical protein VK459_23285 [Polyangiaceae bacterium]|nr:hypothetical protein [Polyangiaceae bacterium]
MSPRALPFAALFLASLAAISLAALPAGADAPKAPTTVAVALDRVVARWFAPETGGPSKPQHIFERELAFQARIEALASPDPEPSAFNDRHVRAALDRHIAETLLAKLPILPVPSLKEIAVRAELARGVLEQRAGSRARLLAAAEAEAIGSLELDAILFRQARASLYLDRMIAPMLEPSELELRSILRTHSTPFRDQPFDAVAPALRRWYIGQRLSQALDAYYQNARSRVTVVLISRR